MALISHASKVMLKILQARLNSMWTKNFQMFKLDLEKAEKQEVKFPTSVGSKKKQESSRKASTPALLTTPKPLTVWITTKCGKFFKRGEYQIPLLASWETCMQVKKQQLEHEMEPTDWFKIGIGVCHGCILSPCLFNLYAEYIMQNAGLDESQAGIKIVRRNINNLRYADNTTLMAESKEEKTSLLMKLKEESEKNWLKAQHKKKWWSWHLHFMANRMENKHSNRLYFLGFQNHCSLLTAAMKLKDACSLEEKLGWT